MIFFLTNLSSIENIFGINELAAFLSVDLRIALITVRVDLCWYLFLKRLALFERILFNDDLWFAIYFIIKGCKSNYLILIFKCYVLIFFVLTIFLYNLDFKNL